MAKKRSRTGCQECKARHQKCDERRPCGRCVKSGRECVPCAINFRHQQNASLNSIETRSTRLRRFFAYRNTFDAKSVWVDIPKRVRFVNSLDQSSQPGSDHEESCGHSGQTENDHARGEISFSERTSTPADVCPDEPHYSEALSRSAHQDRGFLSLPRGLSHSQGSISNQISASVWRRCETSLMSIPAGSGSVPSTRLGPSLVPLVTSVITDGRYHNTNKIFKADNAIEINSELALLLRYFSEGPGAWMDLFDQENFFGHQVPIKAKTNSLLRYAGAALAAKQLYRVKVRKAVGGVCSEQAPLEAHSDESNLDWEHRGVMYYDRAISTLMKIMTIGQQTYEPQMTCREYRKTQEYRPETKCMDNLRRRETTHSIMSSDDSSLVDHGHSLEDCIVTVDEAHTAPPDDLAAAIAILCVYESLDHSINELSLHPEGTMTLLGIAQRCIMPLQHMVPSISPTSSQARRCTFWNIARQDYLSALTNATQTRLDSEDLPMWRDAGLPIDEDGFLRIFKKHDGVEMLGDGMICNALVWIMGKIVNYAVAADTPPLRSNIHEAWVGINQETIHERWNEIQKQLSLWHSGLPKSFGPSACIATNKSSASLRRNRAQVFPELWYAAPMVQATIQSYHMAQMLLLINQPQHSTIGKTTFFKRLESYRAISSEIDAHARAIASISCSTSSSSVRVQSVEPLFYAGQCFERSDERREIVAMLRLIEQDTGWATGHYINQLLNWFGVASENELI